MACICDVFIDLDLSIIFLDDSVANTVVVCCSDVDLLPSNPNNLLIKPKSFFDCTSTGTFAGSTSLGLLLDKKLVKNPF
jgi:hypothetical protein